MKPLVVRGRWSRHTLTRLRLGQADKGAHRAAWDDSCLEDALSFCMLLLAAQGVSQETERCCVMAPVDLMQIRMACYTCVSCMMTSVQSAW